MFGVGDVHAATGGHSERIARCGRSKARASRMRRAKEPLDERRKVTEMVNVDLRTDHVGEQLAVYARSPDLADVVAAEFPIDPDPSPGIDR